MFYGRQQIRYERAPQHVYMVRTGGKSWSFDTLWPTFIGVYQESPADHNPELADI